MIYGLLAMIYGLLALWSVSNDLWSVSIVGEPIHGRVPVNPR